MRKFIQPVVMKCTKQQYIKDLKDKLLSMGYVEDDMNDANGGYDKLCTDFDYKHNNLAFSSGDFRGEKTIRIFEEYNPELFLAIAAMSEGNELHEGEWVCDKGTLRLNRWQGIFPVLSSNTSSDLISCLNNANQKESIHPAWLRKATLEEIQKHFSKNTNQTNMSSSKEEKKIIGYKLIKSEYEKAVCEILADGWWQENAEKNLIEDGWNFVPSNFPGSVQQRIEEAGVLDLWFEPVYEVIKPKLPKIGSYDGAYDRERGIVKYGCVECSNETIYKLNHVLQELDGCHLEYKQTHITKENVEQIIKFIETK